MHRDRVPDILCIMRRPRQLDGFYQDGHVGKAANGRNQLRMDRLLAIVAERSGMPYSTFQNDSIAQILSN